MPVVWLAPKITPPTSRFFRSSRALVASEEAVRMRSAYRSRSCSADARRGRQFVRLREWVVG